MSDSQKKTMKHSLDETEVRIALARRNWKQRDLAHAVGRSVPVVNQAIKHGQNAGTVRRIAEELGLCLKEEEVAA